MKQVSRQCHMFMLVR